jgi:hypothetical protein
LQLVSDTNPTLFAGVTIPFSVTESPANQFEKSLESSTQEMQTSCGNLLLSASVFSGLQPQKAVVPASKASDVTYFFVLFMSGVFGGERCY